MKRILSCLLVLLLISAAPYAQAANEKVIDDAGLLGADEQEKLNAFACAIAGEYGIDAVIVTVASLDGKSAEVYADDYFDDNGFGMGSDDSGVLLLIAIQERQWHISTNAEGVDAVTYSEIGELEEDMVSDLSSGDYYGAFCSYLDFLEAEFSDYRSGTAGIAFSDVVLRLVIALVIGAVIALIVLLIMRSRMNTAKPQAGAGQYMVTDSYDLFRMQDFFLYSRTSRSPKAQTNSNPTHRSSSGRSHGGRGGRF